MLQWMSHVIASGGYWGIAALMALENVVLPIPSELIMPLAGYDVTKGMFNFWGVVLAGTVGSVLGALPLYLPARILGQERVSAWIERHGKWLLLRKSDLDKAHERFERRGGFVAVAVSQLLPGIRSLTTLPAGFARMNIVSFLAANFVGTLVWAAGLTVAGRMLGPSFMKVDKVLGPTGWAVLAVTVVVGVVWLKRRGGR